MQITEIIRLSELIGEMGHVKRATRLPNGEAESDSHHSFSLALVCYHVVMSEKLDVDVHKVVLYALVHDLLEIITGDEDTLYFTAEQHAAKREREKQAETTFDELFSDYPELKAALYEYDKLDSTEAAIVFVLDKACTTWTHHPDKGAYARERDITTKADVHRWAERQRAKINARLAVVPPEPIMTIYEQSFHALEELYDE